MSEDGRPATTAAAQRVSPLLVVCWRSRDGSIVSGSPLPRRHAEALARAFARVYPRQAYWLEPLPWLQTTASRAFDGPWAD